MAVTPGCQIIKPLSRYKSLSFGCVSISTQSPAGPLPTVQRPLMVVPVNGVDDNDLPHNCLAKDARRLLSASYVKINIIGDR